MSAETWRPVVGYEGRYEVSDAGRVRSLLTSRIRRAHPAAGTSYLTVALHNGTGRYGRSTAVHVIVAAAFLGPRPEGHDVRHLNGDRHDNRPSNLAYGTRSQNNLDAVEHGTNANTAKTHCPVGHPYDAANTRITMSNGRPGRRCRRCERTQENARRALARQQVTA